MRPCVNFAKGYCRFGDSCCYAHDANARLSTTNNGSNRETSNNTINELLQKLLQQLEGNDVIPLTLVPTGSWSAARELSPHSLRGKLLIYTGHCITETASGTFSGAWNHGLRASSHLNSSVTSLNTVFNTWGEVLRHLVSSNFISYNKEKPPVLCHACQLGKHVRLPFINSSTVISSCFDIIHSDVWTSPILSLSGFKYYVLFLDHYSQFVWVYPLVNKSDVMSKFVLFRNYVRTQFKCEIKSFQCDHGGEFDNRRLHTLFAQNGIQFRFSCPQTSQQNGKSERMYLDSCPEAPDTDVVRCMWLIRHKYLADGTLSRYKAQLVANGSTQLEGVDVNETFSLVVKPWTIRTVLSLAGVDTAYLLLYVDDIMLTVSFEICISITRDSSGMFLSQKKYAVEILERAGMVNCNPSRTPGDTKIKLCDTGDVVSDPTLYRSLAGSLQHLTFTRPDISYVVQHVCLHMHDPREPHLSTLKRILHYVCGTLDYGLQLFSSSTKDLVAYSNADWAGCPTTRRLTSGYCVFLGNNLLSWSSKRQPTLSRSSAEAEYRGVANAIVETCWLRNLLRELHTPLSSATLVYCDNVSVVYLSCNPVQHQRTKQIEIDIHFVRDLVATG
ncbi:ribonuclease H-like domain-containing protein [Tanacetum coccineum]|uniref:Ribonuclease H-like domain-containing protein n=1 Tax=Tanacetum coccineum TaxID=301880 RepID=A0ABQ5FUM3_9ASTR